MTNPNSEVAVAVADRLIDGVRPEIADKLSTLTAQERQEVSQAILDGSNAVQDGDALGTVRHDQDSGKVYTRVDCGGVHKWKVSDPANGLDNTFSLESISYPILYPLV